MSDGCQVLIEAPAWDAIMDLPRRMQERVLDAIEDLEQNPRPSGVTKMRGEADTYRVRSGDYRILYTIEDDVLRVLVVKVGHRSDVYR